MFPKDIISAQDSNGGWPVTKMQAMRAQLTTGPS